MKHTPKDHPDFPLLQDALRISQNFLSSINEEIDPRRTAVTTPKGEVCDFVCLCNFVCFCDRKEYKVYCISHIHSFTVSNSLRQVRNRCLYTRFHNCFINSILLLFFLYVFIVYLWLMWTVHSKNIRPRPTGLF